MLSIFRKQLTECSLALSVRQTLDLICTWSLVVEISNSHMENLIKFDIIFPRECEFITGSSIWDLRRCCILRGRRDYTQNKNIISKTMHVFGIVSKVYNNHKQHREVCTYATMWTARHFMKIMHITGTLLYYSEYWLCAQNNQERELLWFRCCLFPKVSRIEA